MPVGVPRFKSNGKDQTLLMLSRSLNARAPSDAQETSSWVPAPIVNRLRTPFTLPVRGERPISHMFLASPARAEKRTVLVSMDQQPGRGKESTGSPARISASYAPVLTASPPSAAASHQSRLELSYKLADEYPTNRRRFPSGDQIGVWAAVLFDLTRCG